MASFMTFSSYLASLGPQAPHHEPSSPDSSSLSSADGCSPTKRPRSDSPETSVSSSSPPDHYFTVKQASVAPTPDTTVTLPLPLSAVAAPTPTSTCVVRSILCATFSDIYHATTGNSFTAVTADTSILSSPGTSPPLSRPLSRRSSTGCSNKSVRFARCTNASVFPALSIEEYDRSPIIPTTESESLELPKRKRGEAEGWIKCVERERAAAAKRGVKSSPSASMCGPRPSLTISSLENPVEGVHGLIEGGYFVGEERDHDESFDETEEMDEDGDDMLVDDQEEGAAHLRAQQPALIQDDSSGDEDHLPEVVESPSLETSQRGLGIERLEVAEAEEEEDEEEEDEEARIKREKEEERARARAKCRERYGLCALGKYTRQEVFQSYDSLGGF